MANPESQSYAFLMEKRDGYNPTTLELSLADIIFEPDEFDEPGLVVTPLPSLQPIMSNITKLCLTHFSESHDLSAIVQQFTSLESLRLQAMTFTGLPLAPLFLPLSTQNLHFHLIAIPIGGDQDIRALSTLISSPQIRRFTITHFKGAGGEHIQRPTFSATSEHCSKYNVQFEIKTVEHTPSILDL